jgi:hypothetical protein
MPVSQLRRERSPNTIVINFTGFAYSQKIFQGYHLGKHSRKQWKMIFIVAIPFFILQKP